LTLEVQPPEQATIVVREREVQSNRTLILAGWITTGALTASAVITGILGAGKAKDLKTLRAADPRDYDDFSSELDSTKSSASSLLLASDVCSGAAVVVGGLSLWLTLTSDQHTETTPEKHVAASEHPLQPGYQENQLQLRGSF
jgi:hypothetical protein